jgi:hypothetical protein
MHLLAAECAFRLRKSALCLPSVYANAFLILADIAERDGKSTNEQPTMEDDKHEDGT